MFGNLNKLDTMKFKICVFITSLILVSCGISEAVINRPTTWAQKIQSSSFQNLYKVDENLFRSEQPTKMGMKELQDLGVKTILNVRNLRNDNCEGKSSNLILKRKKPSINRSKMTYRFKLLDSNTLLLIW